MDIVKPHYKRVMLKLSGEALAGDKKTGLDSATMAKIILGIPFILKSVPW